MGDYTSKSGHNGHGFPLTEQTVRDFPSYIVDRPEEGEFTIDRALFSDAALFELEMKYIFV